MKKRPLLLTGLLLSVIPCVLIAIFSIIGLIAVIQDANKGIGELTTINVVCMSLTIVVSLIASILNSINIQAFKNNEKYKKLYPIIIAGLVFNFFMEILFIFLIILIEKKIGIILYSLGFLAIILSDILILIDDLKNNGIEKINTENKTIENKTKQNIKQSDKTEPSLEDNLAKLKHFKDIGKISEEEYIKTRNYLIEKELKK